MNANDFAICVHSRGFAVNGNRPTIPATVNEEVECPNIVRHDRCRGETGTTESGQVQLPGSPKTVLPPFAGDRQSVMSKYIVWLLCRIQKFRHWWYRGPTVPRRWHIYFGIHLVIVIYCHCCPAISRIATTGYDSLCSGLCVFYTKGPRK